MGLAVPWASPRNGWVFECSVEVVQQCPRAPSQRERGDSHRLADCFLVRGQHGSCHPWRRNRNRSLVLVLRSSSATHVRCQKRRMYNHYVWHLL